jgi:hypothetical protein
MLSPDARDAVVWEDALQLLAELGDVQGRLDEVKRRLRGVGEGAVGRAFTRVGDPPSTAGTYNSNVVQRDPARPVGVVRPGGVAVLVPPGASAAARPPRRGNMQPQPPP